MTLVYATEEWATRLRNDLAATPVSLIDEQVDEIYQMSAELHPSSSRAADVRARLIAIRRLLAGASKLVDYTQNASEESLSDVSTNLQRLHKLYDDELTDILAEESITASSLARWGSMKKTPTTIKEFPDA